MGLFSFLKKKPTNTSIYMMEDDFCQLEIVPISNWDFLTKQAVKIDEFSKAHFDGVGFTDIIARENNPFTTLQLSIPISDVEDILAKNNFLRIKQINYNGERILDYNEGITRAYGDNDFAIWTEVKDNIIKNLWITCRGAGTTERRTEIASILNNLGRQYRLILADWNICEIIDLSKDDEVATYLQNHC